MSLNAIKCVKINYNSRWKVFDICVTIIMYDYAVNLQAAADRKICLQPAEAKQ